MWFGGWQATSDEDAAAHHWHLTDGGLTAFAGQLWPRGEGWRGGGSWAAQLSERFRSAPLTQCIDDLAGVYVAVSLPRRGRAVVAPDPLGFGLVYWGQGRDIVVISSRAELAAGLLATDCGVSEERDVLAAGWLVFTSRSIGFRTGFKHVSVTAPGEILEIGPQGHVWSCRPVRPSWKVRPLSTVLAEEALLEARAEMVTAIRTAIDSRAGPTCAGLTGGKDSRLILALLLAEGLAGDVEFQTLGAADLPDVMIATRIAEDFGLRHVVNPVDSEASEWTRLLGMAVQDAGYSGLSSREINLRIAASMSSGARNVGDPTARRPFGDRVLINGMCGETLRATWPFSARCRTKSEAATIGNVLKFGTLGILRPDALDYYRAEMHKLMFDDCRSSDSAGDIIDEFYMRHWFRRWFGDSQEFDFQHRIFPLYSMAALRLAFGIGAENRHADWIHYELMRRSCEPLVNEPFASGSWHSEAGRELRPPQRYNDPAPLAPPRVTSRAVRSSKQPKRTVGRDLRAAAAEVDLDMMRRFLCDDQSNPLFEIVDPVATRRAVDAFATLNERDRVQLYGALTGAIWLGGHEIALPHAVLEPADPSAA